jgi:hypothetical protein
VIWRFGAGLFLIVNVQILDDGAVHVIGASIRPRRSAPPAPSFNFFTAGIAQSEERRSRKAEAGCSIHPASTMRPQKHCGAAL